MADCKGQCYRLTWRRVRGRQRSSDPMVTCKLSAQELRNLSPRHVRYSEWVSVEAIMGPCRMRM